MKNIKVLLWYDVEDFITPEADDALLALLDMMHELGIRSSLKIVGEKIRVLQQRGRSDIITKLADHEIGYHTESHSIHPTQLEYLKDMGFAKGAEEWERNEKKGFESVQSLTGQFPACYGQPGGSWVPQAFPVLKKWGIHTYLDSHDLISVEEKPFWYGGLLNLTHLWSTMRLEFVDGGLEAAQKEFDSFCERAEAFQLVSIYYHPCEFACTEFWDGVNFNKGRNTPRNQWRPAKVRSKEEMKRRVALLGRFLRYTMQKPGVEYITARQVMRYVKADPSPLTRRDILEIAGRVSGGPDYDVAEHRSLCASEILSLFSRFVLGRQLTPECFYGPECESASYYVQPVTLQQLARAVAEQSERVLGYKQLPVLYYVGENRLNPLDVFMALAWAISDNKESRELLDLQIGRAKLLPARHVNTDYNWAKGWDIFPDTLEAPEIVRHAVRQTWTLKPVLWI